MTRTKITTLVARGLVLAIALTACAKTDLKLRDGHEVAGIVEGADDIYLYVQLDQPTTAEEAAARASYAQPRLDAGGVREEGRHLYRIPRSMVAGTSPPGRAAGIAGMVIMTAGLGLALGGILQVQSCQGRDFCGIGHAFLTIPGAVAASAGAPVMMAGWIIYGNTAAAARPRTATMRLMPTVSPPTADGVRGDAGMMTTVSW